MTQVMPLILLVALKYDLQRFKLRFNLKPFQSNSSRKRGVDASQRALSTTKLDEMAI